MEGTDRLWKVWIDEELIMTNGNGIVIDSWGSGSQDQERLRIMIVIDFECYWMNWTSRAVNSSTVHPHPPKSILIHLTSCLPLGRGFFCLFTEISALQSASFFWAHNISFVSTKRNAFSNERTIMVSITFSVAVSHTFKRSLLFLKSMK